MAAIAVISILVIASVGAAAYYMLRVAPGGGGGSDNGENGTPLSVSISSDTTSGDVPLAVKFSSTVIGGKTPHTYNWDFGDGQHGTAANPDHTYLDEGNYTVKLLIRDSSGKSKESSMILVNGLKKPAINQLLIYDPTGKNLKPSGRAGTGLVTAYLVNITDNNKISKIPVQIDPAAFPTGQSANEPMTVSGQFSTAKINGETIIKKITATSDAIIRNGSFGGYAFRNIEAHLSSISIVADQHTFGFGYGR